MPEVAREGEPMTLGVVIVNWNSGGMLRTCLEALACASTARYRLTQVVVVDNGSCDGSGCGAEGVALPLLQVRNAANRGFAAAANQGAAELGTDLVLFLNPDCAPREDAIDRAVEALLDGAVHPPAGAAGIRLLDDHGRTARHCARRPRPGSVWRLVLGVHRLLPGRGMGLHMDDWDHATSRQVDHVMGAFYLMRLDLFRALGGFDERFFVYLEDLDLSARIADRGFSVRYVAEAAAHHVGGGSSRQVKARRLAYSLHSRILYGFKHFPRRQAVALAIATVTLEPLIRIAVALAGGSPGGAAEVCRGTGMLWFRLVAGRWTARGS